MKTITAAPVTPTKDGYWCHPDLPEFDEGQGAEWNAWLDENHLEVSHSLMEDDSAAEAAFERYMAGEGSLPLEWSPALPDGEGWFLLFLTDTEDGPVACFARTNLAAADSPTNNSQGEQ
jgi:hypothetical protein